MKTVDHENQPVRMAFSVTHGRVEHYSDVVEYMARAEVERFTKEHGRPPSASQVAFLKKEIVRYAVIRHDLETAQKIRINPSIVLFETPSYPARVITKFR